MLNLVSQRAGQNKIILFTEKVTAQYRDSEREGGGGNLTLKYSEEPVTPLERVENNKTLESEKKQSLLRTIEHFPPVSHIRAGDIFIRKEGSNS